MTEHYDEIHGFDSPGEFSRFKEWLSAAIKDGDFEEVPVESRYWNVENFDEKWFRDFTGVIWRLVAPDPPFTGVFMVVSHPGEPSRQSP
ncbi:hypothetical protein HTZ77_37160 [Nonomuraea sp. SMC257]|uniref:Uncharacterized protein n=1 Tax=Nonomuraea montanisoli TaxID=2741721 RepID=A0A7Y6M724_9ACTN|nr:hypothetical protein [Nonomuraea montanisoli]NUW36992.1 hypothetical protein [Nonomuraea montanisoli]